MKSPRLGLSRHVQVFFEVDLCGLFRFDQAEIDQPEQAELPKGWSPLRRPPLGKYREIVSVRFGVYNLRVSSPSEVPPLGEIVLIHPDGRESGPLDETTWKRMGAIVRAFERGEHDAA